MANDNIKKSGVITNMSDERGGAVLIPYPVIGIVKDNNDAARSGRIKVYISRFSGPNPDDAQSWIPVQYLSPFYGITTPYQDIYNSPDTEGDGKFVGNPHTYGFWAAAPDIGTTVICVFVDGKPRDGYYIGCVPEPGLNHMIPAVAGSTAVVPNQEEAPLYGGADRLPVTEVNYGNASIRKSSSLFDEPKPVHSYQANILAKQGLIRDAIRGVIGSSAQRESPSRVFGISTPGQAIYTGKYTKNDIESSATSADSSKLQVEGRTGGHSFVMDDGTLDGQDQLMRFRTTAGHTILLSDNGQVVTIIHSNGQSWIEMNKEGAIDAFSTNSVNIRTQGDINLHADRDINMHAKRNFNLFADNIKIQATQNYTLRTGKDYNSYHIGKYTVKVDEQMSMDSKGDSSYKSSAITYINGDKIHLNTGASSTVPKVVPELDKIKHTETVFSQSKGWMYPGPEPLESIVTRAPTHMPWKDENKGVAL